jgi:hypothetical protein
VEGVRTSGRYKVGRDDDPLSPVAMIVAALARVFSQVYLASLFQKKDALRTLPSRCHKLLRGVVRLTSPGDA